MVPRIAPDGTISSQESWPGTGPDIVAALVTFGSYIQTEDDEYDYYSDGRRPGGPGLCRPHRVAA